MVAESPDQWSDRAACRGDRGVDRAWFFSSERADQLKAKLVCASCPVRSQCLDYALAIAVDHHIWGGLDPAERAREARVRGGRYR